MSFVGFKGNLQHSVPQAVPIEAGDGHGCLIVGHGDEAKSLALVGVEVTDDLDVVHCAKGAKELPRGHSRQNQGTGCRQRCTSPVPV